MVFCLVEQILYLLLRSIECFWLKMMERKIHVHVACRFLLSLYLFIFFLPSVIVDIKLIVVVVMAVVVDVGL